MLSGSLRLGTDLARLAAVLAWERCGVMRCRGTRCQWHVRKAVSAAEKQCHSTSFCGTAARLRDLAGLVKWYEYYTALH